MCLFQQLMTRIERRDFMSSWQQNLKEHMEKLQAEGLDPDPVDMLTLELAGKLDLLSDSICLKRGYVLTEPRYNRVKKVKPKP